MRNKKSIARAKAGYRKKNAAVHLKLRRQPTQSRGQQTFDRILQITGQLLDDVGADAITTNLIAQAAGINVATLYQYFPNKRAILVRLFQEQARKRKDSVEHAFMAARESGSDWRAAVEAAIDAVYQTRHDEPGSLRLAQAIRSDPALSAYDRTEAREISGWLATQIAQAATIPESRAQLVARCATESVRALLDLEQLDESLPRDQILQQAKDLAAAYLAPYLGAASRPDRRRRASR